MPTPIVCTGFSQQFPGAFTVTGATTPTSVADSPSGSGSSCIDFTVAASTSALALTPTSALISGDVLVQGFAFKPASCSSATAGNVTFCNGPGGTFPGLTLTTSLTLTTPVTPTLTTPVLSNKWYWVDYLVNSTSTTWIQALVVTDLTIGIQIYNASSTATHTAGALSGSGSFGQGNSGTSSYRIDDVVLSLTATDFPLGPHHVLGLVPSSYDATDTVTAADFAWNDGTTNNQSLATGLPATAISEIPWTASVGTSSSYVKQITGSASANAVFYTTWASTTSGIQADIVCGTMQQYLESGSTSSSPTVQVVAGGAGGTITTLSTAAITSSAAPKYSIPTPITAPTGGWTTPNLLGSLIEYGQATVVTSPPCLGNVMLEAAFPYSFPTAPPLVVGQSMKRASYF